MYELLHFKHPLYLKTDSKLGYIKKLRNNPKFAFNKQLSKMSQSLLLKLLEVNPLYRYNVFEALNHPFITRRKYDSIPMTLLETIKKSEIKGKFKEVIGGLFFILYFKEFQKATNKAKLFKFIPKEYIEKAESISIAIKSRIMKNKDNCLTSTTTNSDHETPISKLHLKTLIHAKIDLRPETNIVNNNSTHIKSRKSFKSNTSTDSSQNSLKTPKNYKIEIDSSKQKSEKKFSFTSSNEKVRKDHKALTEGEIKSQYRGSLHNFNENQESVQENKMINKIQKDFPSKHKKIRTSIVKCSLLPFISNKASKNQLKNEKNIKKSKDTGTLYS